MTCDPHCCVEIGCVVVALLNLHAVFLDEHAVAVPFVAHVSVDIIIDLVHVASVRASLLVTYKTHAYTISHYSLDILFPYIWPVSETGEMIHNCSRIGCDTPDFQTVVVHRLWSILII